MHTALVAWRSQERTLHLWLGDHRNAHCTCGLGIRECTLYLWLGDHRNAHCTCGLAITGTRTLYLWLHDQRMQTVLMAWRSENAHCACGLVIRKRRLHLWFGDHRNTHCTGGLAISKHTLHLWLGNHRNTHTVLVAWWSEEHEHIHACMHSDKITMMMMLLFCEPK